MNAARAALAVALLTLSASAVQAAQIPTASQPSLVIGSDGLGLVAYKDEAGLDLEVAHCVDAACSAVTTVTVDSAGDVGGRASLALRPGGLPLITYEDATNGDLKLALCADALCSAATTVVVDPDLQPGGTGRTEVAIGGDGLPLVAYVNGAIGLANGRLRVAHCEDLACGTTTISELGDAYGAAALRIGGDGLGTVAWSVRTIEFLGLSTGVEVRHCDNAACTSASVAPGVHMPTTDPSVAIGAGGLPAFTFSNTGTSLPPGTNLRRCQDVACSASASTFLPDWFGPASLAIDGVDRPRLAASAGVFLSELRVLECGDASCTSYQHACLATFGLKPSLALDAAGAPLAAFEQGETVGVTRPVAACERTLTITTDFRIHESDLVNVSVALSSPAPGPVTVAFATVDGTAEAWADYIPVAGTLTFAPGENLKAVTVSLVDDDTYERDETFEVVLSSPSGAPIVDDRAVVTIVDDDGPDLSVSDCGVTEGDTGTAGCSFQVSLSFAPLYPVPVYLQTLPQGANEGTDYLRLTGFFTFTPGTLSQAVTVSVVGDVLPEPDEQFLLIVRKLGFGLGDGTSGTGHIIDDDWPSLPGLELTHGSSLTADLQSDPGPTADQDDYRVSQPPFTSHEFVLDQVSGDAAPGVRLLRIAADGTTVLESSAPIGLGPAGALRFANDLPVSVTNQYVRVAAASCGVACGPDDIYRLRAYETTGAIPRFNNAGSQTSVLILQNATSRGLTATAHFWDAAGGLRASRTFFLPPRATRVESIAGIPGLSGVAGSVTVTHTGPYGGLVGKAVALEPSTGFSFDSPLTVKPR
jgi:hypothetical protein